MVSSKFQAFTSRRGVRMLEKINEILIDITDTQRYLILVADTESSKNAKINFLKLVIKENKKITKNCEMLIKELENEQAHRESCG